MIRPEAASDAPAIAAVHDAAFGGTVESGIVDALRARGKLLISLVEEEDGKILGHAAYSPISHKNRVIGIGLGPVAVLPAHQKSGIGSKLILEGNAMAFSRHYENIFVLGDPAYYRRFGFDLARTFNFFTKFDPDGGHFMVLSRNPEYPPEKVQVEYDKAFDLAARP